MTNRFTIREYQNNRAKKERCIYCGIQIYRNRNLCDACNEKLQLIRKIRGIVFEIKRCAQQEASHEDQR